MVTNFEFDGTPAIELSSEYAQLMEKGLTVKSVEYNGGMENTTTNTIHIELKDIPEAEF